jgi:predicted O-methyltransferase YrrM
MSNLTYFARVLKHPGFILNENFLLHPIASFYTSKKILQNNMSLLDGIQKLTGESLENLKKYLNDISNNTKLLNHLDDQFDVYYDYIGNSDLNNLKFSKENPAGRLNRQSQNNAGFFLYVLVRSLKPEIFVETGVSAGESSTFILQAMHDNNFGKLYSVDLPRATVEKGLTTIIPEGKSSGWLIPESLKDRWELHLGKSEEILPKLFSKLQNIDVFFHDSLHTYDHMMFEYQSCWDYLKDGGILFSDDIIVMNGKGHSPLVDFADMQQKEIVVYNVLGGLRK